MSLKEKVALYINGNPKRIADIEIDCFVLEQLNMGLKCAEHPIQGGSTISDHISQKPLTLKIDGFISNAGTLLDIRSAFNNNSGDALKKLKDLLREKKTISVGTSLGQYKNMVLEDLSVERTVDTANGLKLSCVFKQINIAVAENVKTTVGESSTKEKTHIGKQTTKKTSKETMKELKKTQSLIYRFSR